MKRILAFAFFLLFLAGIALVNLKAIDVAAPEAPADASDAATGTPAED